MNGHFIIVTQYSFPGSPRVKLARLHPGSMSQQFRAIDPKEFEDGVVVQEFHIECSLWKLGHPAEAAKLEEDLNHARYSTVRVW